MQAAPDPDPPDAASRPLRLPRLGFGAAAIGNLYQPVSDAAADEALGAATEAAGALLDTAPYYGHGLSEQRIGRFLRRRPERRPLISTKVGRRLEPCATPGDFGFADPAPFQPVFDYSADGARAAFASSLERLGVERVDLLLLHDVDRPTHGADQPKVMNEAAEAAWPAMQALQAEGRAALIGLGVNSCETVTEALDRGFGPDVVLLAGRHTLLDASAERSGLLARCRAEGIVLLAAAPFNSGLLAGGEHFNYAEAPAPLRAAAARLKEACRRYETPLPAAALQFPLRDPAVSTVVAGARSRAEVEQQRRWLEHSIPAELWSELDDLRAELAVG